MTTAQKEWRGTHGTAWAKRNAQSWDGLNEHYLSRYKVSREYVNEAFLEGVPRGLSVLEVGCSAGVQLTGMLEAGFGDVAGVDLALEPLETVPGPAAVADGCALPFADNSFGVVMMSGTYMHIPPDEKTTFIAECCRVASDYIYGVEGWTDELVTWNFGDLLPPAWTGDVHVQTWPGFECRRWAVLENRDANLLKPIHLMAFLLEAA